MAKNWKGSTTKRMPPDGTARLSQVVTTFGPGALMDLVDRAVLVGGLDFWHYGRHVQSQPIKEHRLRDALAPYFNNEERTLSVDAAFRAPPIGDDTDPSKFCGIQVLEFPEWMVCQNPDCRALVHSRGLDFKSNRYHHHCLQNSGKKGTPCVPVRFVSACRRGHLQDFPWIPFVHMGGARCAAPNLQLLEGATGDFSEITVRCSCGATQKLSTAISPDFGFTCEGQRPWLGPDGKEACDEKLRLLVRTASNSYFSQTVSALSIPEKGKALEEAVQSVWDVMAAATLETLPVFRKIPKVQKALQDYDDKSVLDTVERRKSGIPIGREPIRTAEFSQLVSSPKEIPGELPREEDNFFARTLDVASLPNGIAQIVLATKLREVMAQIGFTRLEPATANLQGEYDLDVQSAATGLVTDWLPATEIRGEGIFVRLDEAAVNAWESRTAVKDRAKALFSGYQSWTGRMDKPPAFPGARFYLLHSLSHLLISALSLECGYAASAIRERIYCAPAHDPTPMAAILLSTGSSGSEGTLGGLVEQGRHLVAHLRRAYRLGVLCSNDPVCAHHSPDNDPAERYLEGAACHGCLFIAECSCERFNRYLDRALVVPTIGHSPDLAFFAETP